jgi:hypothetical protein
MAQESAKRGAERVTGIANVTSDVVTLLNNALEGAAALELYQQDAREAGDQEAEALFTQLQQQLSQQILQLKQCLQKRL